VGNTAGRARASVLPVQDAARGELRGAGAAQYAEHGKTLIESRGDVRRGIEMVEFACGIPSLLTGETIENIARGIDCEAIRQPLGVCVGITPFNFPAMVPLWMYPVALVCGNTFVLKPSEKVPLTAIAIARLLEQAGIPKGVFNIVHGGRECVDALLTHPKVRAISFVGSTPIAKYIYETGTSRNKRVQANGGAKNFVFLMPDADVENSTRGVVEGAFGCAGERCMASSTAVVIGSAATEVLPSLVAAAQSIKVGPTDRDEQPNMGPVITRQHRDRVMELIGAGEKEGAKVLADGRGAAKNGNGFFLGATILDEVRTGMTVANEEIFGPVLNVMRMDDLDSAIEMVNRSPLETAPRSSRAPAKRRASSSTASKQAWSASTSACRHPWLGSRSMAGMTPSSATCTCKDAKAFSSSRS
jgi:malonate-semialdehyde dehydrogenase (acetylating)/methylmalonate-semialdehyde dehydrogenase